MADEVDLLGRALDQAHQVLLGAADGDPGAPTPCRSWDLARLRDHVVSDLDRFLVAARGERPDWSAPEPDQRGDRAAAFRTGADAVLAAWRTADRSAPVQTQMGEVPASFVISQQTAEMAVHAWDLAQATGQRVTWDDEVAGSALGWARQTLKPQFRGDEAQGKVFGPEVAATADAPAQDQLVAWFGRDPGQPLAGQR
jgi:uncharacterized protein (TIGR03086 family)